jgi:SAM-dependent methyltransferase
VVSHESSPSSTSASRAWQAGGASAAERRGVVASPAHAVCEAEGRDNPDMPDAWDQATYWSDQAAAWVELEDHLEALGGAFGQAAMARLDLRPGQRVLDVGCGTGVTTEELARAVGPSGEVVGIDISGAMLTRARDRTDWSALARVEFVEADAQVADLGGGFEAVFSRFGVMFFDDPLAAFTNLRGALVPGGRLAAAVWQDLFANEWVAVPGLAVVSVTGEMPEVDPDGPGPFSMAAPAVVERLLGAAGFVEVSVEPAEQVVEVPEDGIEAFIRADARIGAGAELLADAAPEVRREAWESVRSALVDRLDGGVVRLRSAGNLVTAAAPA